MAVCISPLSQALLKGRSFSSIYIENNNYSQAKWSFETSNAYTNIVQSSKKG